MENFLEETNKIIKEFEIKSSSDAEIIGRMAAEIYKLRSLREALKKSINDIASIGEIKNGH